MIQSELSNKERLMELTEEKPKNEPEFSVILRIPKTVGIIDYIKRELQKRLPGHYEELIDALFELHRTSTGFNPAVLSKARFKRMKVTECKLALHEIDREMKNILDSEEYGLLFGNNYNYEQITSLQNQLNGAKESKDVYRFSMLKLQLKNLLLERNEYELLLWLHKISIDYYSRNNQLDLCNAALNDYIKSFNDLRDKINLKVMVDRSTYKS